MTVATAAAKLTTRAVKTPARPHRPSKTASPRAPVPSTSAPASWSPPAPLPEPTATVIRTGWSHEDYQLPAGYGDHHITLMVKDPWWIYAYWEIQPHRERQLKQQLSPDEMAGLQSVVRVYDITGVSYPNQPAQGWFDVVLSNMAASWFIHTNAPDRSFIVEIGLLTRGGRFLMLARSNAVTTPRAGPSDVVDEEWMTADELYWKLLGMSAGIGMGGSPSGLKALLTNRLFSGALTSPGLFSPVKVQSGRNFWLWVDAELIVYGATDPKATVTIQGQPVHLKSDGTFSVRMSLPDGAQVIPVEAISPDQQEARTITPTVTRKTEATTADSRLQTSAKKRLTRSDV